MEFRWVALLALWTILSGPILGGPVGSASRMKERPRVTAPADRSLSQHSVPHRARVDR
jgi:hypothetical protein